jgi:hypothetical protein
MKSGIDPTAYSTEAGAGKAADMGNTLSRARNGARRLARLQRRVLIAETLVGPVLVAALTLAALGTAWWLALLKSHSGARTATTGPHVSRGGEATGIQATDEALERPRSEDPVPPGKKNP